MKNMMHATLCIALLVLAVLQISHAAVITNVSVPVNIPVFIPCAAGGTGELVVLSGDLHVLVRFTRSKSGGVHAAAHFQPQGISGVGQTTGEKYQATGVTQDVPRMSSMQESEWKKHSSTIFVSLGKQAETTF